MAKSKLSIAGSPTDKHDTASAVLIYNLGRSLALSSLLAMQRRMHNDVDFALHWSARSENSAQSYV